MPLLKKDLAYANYEAFTRSAEFDYSKINFNNPKICNSLLAMLDSGNKLLSNGDDENAYAILMRFVDGFFKLRSSKLYKEDKTYVDNFITNEKITKTLATLEKLKEDIKSRYVEREQKLLLDKMKVLSQNEASASLKHEATSQVVDADKSVTKTSLG